MRTWLRARYAEDGQPLASQVKGVHLNAAWVAQAESVENEVLGASNGMLMVTACGTAVKL